MKVLCTDHIDVTVPVERIFAFVSDISRWPVWFTPVVCAEHPERLPVALDEELLLCFGAGRRRWHEKFEVSRFVPNAFLSLEGSFSAARRIDFRFEQRGMQTRIACGIGYRVFGGFPRTMVDGIFNRPRVRRELHESLTRLKGVLEEQTELGMLGDDVIHQEPDADHRRYSTPAGNVTEPAGAV